MNKQDLRGRISKLQGVVYALESKYESIKKLKDELSQWEKLEGELVSVVQCAKIVYESCLREESDYKESRKVFLELFITEELASIFPDERYTAKLQDYIHGGKLHVSLKLIDKSGKVRFPDFNEGKLCQELTNFACSFGILKASGMNKFYIDEAFVAASPNNLTNLSANLKRVVDEGVQVFCMEQFPDIYKNLPRRQIGLVKEGLTGFTTMDYCTDYGEE